jgi:hypothetical protein
VEIAGADSWPPMTLKRLTWRWHVGPTNVDWLRNAKTWKACECAVSGGQWQFAFARRRQSALGAMELTDNNKPLFQSVSVDLNRLLRQVHQSVNSVQDAMAKITSLAGMVMEIGRTRTRMIDRAHLPSCRANRAGMFIRIRTGRLANNSFAQLASTPFHEIGQQDPHLDVKTVSVADEWPLIDLHQPTATPQPLKRRNFIPPNRLRVRVSPTHRLAAGRLRDILERYRKSGTVDDLIIENSTSAPKPDSQPIGW